MESSEGRDLESNWCLMRTATGPEDGTKEDCCTECCRTQACNNSCAPLYRLFMTRCYGHLCRVGAVVCGSASCLILWSELVMASSLR